MSISAGAPASSLQKYLDKALAVLQRYGILPSKDTPPELTRLLEEVRHVDEAKVMTVKIADDLLGSRGGDWGILATAAFVSIAVPLLVFFAMQKYLVRGLLAGSVK